jgi:hypothetical protein
MLDKKRLETDLDYFVEIVSGKNYKMRSAKKSQPDEGFMRIVSFGTSTVSTQAIPVCTQEEEKKEKNMNDFDQTEAGVAKYHLKRTISRYADAVIDGYRAQYNLDDEKTPDTAADLVARITAGKYVFTSEEDSKRHTWGNPIGYIQWRDPAKVKDEAGYEKAVKALKKDLGSALNQIIVLTPAQGLDALNAFETAYPVYEAPVAS